MFMFTIFAVLCITGMTKGSNDVDIRVVRSDNELEEDDKGVDKIMNTLQDVCIYERPDKTVQQLLKDTNAIIRNIEIYKEVVKRNKILKKEIKWIIEGTCVPKQFKDCSGMKGKTLKSGVYTIYPEKSNGIKAYCDMSTDGGGWTVIQRRTPDRTTSFDRNWIGYREGFGDPKKELWIGNKYLNILTSKDKYELRVDLTDTSNKKTYALYKTFVVGDDSSKYKLTIGNHSGTAGNYMAHNNGRAFSTKEKDNDSSSGHCALSVGAWWHGSCSDAFFNNVSNKNLYWNGYNYVESKMMIRKIM